jgi:1,4-alpha-glucan branching enzyme
MTRGYLALVLHAHLPYVRHPEYESFLEEHWLFEAIIDTYVPLIRVFERLKADGVPFRVTLSISPTLMAMLGDPLLRERFVAHLGKLTRLGDKEILRTQGDPRLLEVARMYRRLLYETEETFVGRCGGDLLSAFRKLQDAGVLEIATAAATHGYLPILKTSPAAARVQLQVAAESYHRTFARTVPGFWLPECGYYPGVEDLVAEAGGRYFFVDTHAILNAEKRPRYGYVAPLTCGNGVAAFGRDPESSRQVWSADEGYPGDPWYRDFYRDIGFDLDFEIVKPYSLDGHTRIFTGFKYYRITGKTEDKEPYEPERARERVEAHAQDFVRRQLETVDRFAPAMDRPPIIVALYDAELFGHWWFEGPQWLDRVIRRVATEDLLEMVTPSDDLARHPKPQQARPSASSWGEKGYSAFWLNPGNDWIYRHLHDAAVRMHTLAGSHADAPIGSPADRALRQAARSLLLAQASDWPFIMKTGTAVEYAYNRIRDNLARFHYLCSAVEADGVDEARLAALETMDAIFPELDFRIYA